MGGEERLILDFVVFEDLGKRRNLRGRDVCLYLRLLLYVLEGGKEEEEEEEEERGGNEWLWKDLDMRKD